MQSVDPVWNEFMSFPIIIQSALSIPILKAVVFSSVENTHIAHSPIEEFLGEYSDFDVAMCVANQGKFLDCRSQLGNPNHLDTQYSKFGVLHLSIAFVAKAPKDISGGGGANINNITPSKEYPF